jgi:hypothetical protein
LAGTTRTEVAVGTPRLVMFSTVRGSRAGLGLVAIEHDRPGGPEGRGAGAGAAGGAGVGWGAAAPSGGGR